MSLIPEFELGLWNAWIITVLFYVATLTPLQIGKKKANQRGEGEPAWSEVSKTHRTAILITHAVILPFTIGYSIFLPLKLGTEWLYVGILISAELSEVCQKNRFCDVMKEKARKLGIKI